MTATTSLAPLLERFFTQRLMQERRVSPHTISSYRDTFRRFLKFTQQRLHKPPSALEFEEIDAPNVVRRWRSRRSPYSKLGCVNHQGETENCYFRTPRASV
jgi:site-specific recombinase XerC